MGQKMVAGALVLVASFAWAKVEARRYKSVGDVVYAPQEDTSSCGKAPRDLVRKLVTGTRTVTVSAGQVRLNDGEPWDIVHTDDDSVLATRSRKDPLPRYPDRVVVFGMMVARAAEDDYVLIAMRRVTSGPESCADAFRVSLE